MSNEFVANRLRLAEAEHVPPAAIPDARIKTTLQRVVQVLKVHRNQFFADDLDQRPASIVLTTLRSLRAAGTSGVHDPHVLFLALALDDIRRAADLLRPVYDPSDGRDGFVSFECTPDLAHDTAATIEQAVYLWNRLAAPRPN